MNKITLLTALIISAFGWQSCNEADPEPPKLPDAGVQVNISHSFGSAALEMDGRYYVTENGDSIQPTNLVYHINNFVFITDNGVEVKAAEKYFMVNVVNNSTPAFAVGDLQGKNFTKVRFTLGVADSATNADGLLNTLFIDPMYWSMAAGYINFKLEGRSPAVAGNEVVILHLGGYTGDYKINHTFELDFDGAVVRNELGHNHLNLRMDLSELFKNPNLIDLSVVNDVQMPNNQAKMLAENFSTLFVVDGVN